MLSLLRIWQKYIDGSSSSSSSSTRQAGSALPSMLACLLAVQRLEQLNIGLGNFSDSDPGQQ
jgi:hypothetical protein